jgi:hypothetical protein
VAEVSSRFDGRLTLEEFEVLLHKCEDFFRRVQAASKDKQFMGGECSLIP